MPVDADTARKILQRIAEVEAAAYTERARLAEQGIDEPVNRGKARQLYQRAAAAFHSAEAMRLARSVSQ